MAPYLPGVSPAPSPNTHVEYSGVWRCPGGYKMKQEDVDAEVAAWGLNSMDYGYFARADRWKVGQASHPENLTERELRADRLLMSDRLYQWHVDMSWSYNHGRLPERFGGPDLGPMPGLRGLNQLYGDGRVAWKPARQIQPDKLSFGNNAINVVRAYPVDAEYY